MTPETQGATIDAEDVSVIRACDFRPEFGDARRYLLLPDLKAIIPVHPEGVYFICSRSVLATLRHKAAP